eukprot:SAG31_NODE_2659_length_5284_cov_6.942152_5_plen_223_part_00
MSLREEGRLLPPIEETGRRGISGRSPVAIKFKLERRPTRESPHNVPYRSQKKASRYINKVPKSKRSNRAPKLHDAAADAIVGGASRSFNKFKKGFSKATKQIADATGIESLVVEVKLQLNKEGWMTKLGEVRKSWKRRWFKLDGEVNKVMWYYEDEGCTKEKGQIDLRQVSSVRIAPQDPQRIELVTPDRRASSIDGLLPQRLTRRSFPGLTCWPVAGFVQS